MRPASSMNHACNSPAAQPPRLVERIAIMTVTASYNPVARELFITGDTFGTPIQIDRDAAGTLFVIIGVQTLVEVSGGVPTIANTDLIFVQAGNASTAIALNELHGALPAVRMIAG